MAFHDHLQHEIAFQRFTEEQELTENRDMQQRLPPPTWLNNVNARQQNFLDTEKSVDRNNRSESNCESEDLREYKADILGHPLYDQLLSAHVSCLRIATPVDQLPRIDAQLQQSQRVVEKYSALAHNGVVDEKELDQFMVCFYVFLSLILISNKPSISFLVLQFLLFSCPSTLIHFLGLVLLLPRILI